MTVILRNTITDANIAHSVRQLFPDTEWNP